MPDTRKRHLKHTRPAPNRDIAHHAFEKRPRHKTREDRYDYKPNASTIGPRTTKDKPRKRAWRTRKHTINENFHAPNVACERLTLSLQGNKKVGIFHKGKASSPAKLLETTGREILTSRPNKDHAPRRSTSRHNESRFHDRQKQSDSRNVPYYHFFQSPPRLGLAWRPPSRQSTTGPLNGSVEAPPALPNCPGYPGLLRNDSDSGTPFTWSETASHARDSDSTIEAHLMRILHAGLLSPRLSDKDSPTTVNKNYCDLEDLKHLLQERKAAWEYSRGSCSVISINAAFNTPSASVGHDASCGIDQAAKPVGLFNSNDHRKKGSSIPFHQDLKQEPQDQSAKSKGFDTVESSQNPLQLIEYDWNPDIEGFEIHQDTDAAFFGSLDAAFWAIMGPTGDSNCHVAGSPNMHSPSRHFEAKNKILLDTMKPSAFGSIDTFLHPAIEVETVQYPKVPMQPETLNQDDHAALQKRSQQREILSAKPSVILATNEPSALHLYNAPQVDQQPPPSFWRKNTWY